MVNHKDDDDTGATPPEAADRENSDLGGSALGVGDGSAGGSDLGGEGGTGGGTGGGGGLTGLGTLGTGAGTDLGGGTDSGAGSDREQMRENIEQARKENE
jgi:hypothetical protein